MADVGPIGVGPDGAVYVADSQRLVRIAPDGVVTLVDTLAPPGGYATIYSVLVDDQGSVFVSRPSGIFRYTSGTSSSRELFLQCTPEFCPEFVALSPDQSKIWVSGYESTLFVESIIAIDPQDGSRELVTYGGTTSCGGMAVVPLRGDITDDRESDAADFSLMISCFNGVNVGPPDPACYGADMDSDWDVDLKDMQSFIRAHTVHNR